MQLASGLLVNKFRRKIKEFKLLFVTIFLAVVAQSSYAGFLEIPTMEEVEEAEEELLLKDIDIPQVSKRDPNPQAGPRINVSQFRVQGLVEYPELGITRQELVDFVETLRFQAMEEEKILESGYTLKELSELQDVIIEIEKNNPDKHIKAEDVQELIFLIRRQRRERGITLGELEAIADKITTHYRSKGFILAKAFIPQQRVRDGVVSITLLLGTLGEVTFQNNRLYKERVIQRYFDDIMTKPVTQNAIEERLYFVNDLPGLAVQGFFSPGIQVGETSLKIIAKQESRFNGNVRIDNHGSDATGEYRLYSDFVVNSPTGRGDQLRLAGLVARKPESATYGSLYYTGPLLSERLKHIVNVSQNAYVVGAESQDAPGLGGKSTTYELGLEYQTRRSRVKTTSWNLSASKVNAKLDVQLEDIGALTIGDDEVNNLSVGYKFDFLNDGNQSVSVGAVSLSYSHIADSVNKENAGYDDAAMFTADYTHLRFAKLPLIKNKVRWVTRFALQYAGQSLLSLNQFALAGPTRSRAFKTNTFFADDGAHLGTDLIFKGLSFYKNNLVLEPMLFADVAYGRVNAPDIEGYGVDNEANFSDVGLGLRFSFLKKINGNFTAAIPTSSSLSGDLEQDFAPKDDVKLYMEMQYRAF